ncbi:putative membrane protein [Devosia crocina]|uniref:Putative membrane protein n=1 Tax=Devosia crocina TaxID=429728 RepID=A0A1I7N0R6_9HYPH|nr:cytochrome c oxidase assembly protein [Devosia crocina]SFV28218.1 putative membrane protein [Devosia crocina]
MDPVTGFSFAMSYCGQPPLPDTIWARWNLDPILLTALAGAGGLGLHLLRKATGKRKLAFAAAWLFAAMLFVSPLCALTVALFSGRVTHHVLLTMGVAPLLALALPARWGQTRNLLLPLSASTIALWLWHSPDLYTAAFAHPAIYWAMQLSLLASFTWLWLGLLHSRATLAAGITALTSAIQMGFLGALLVFAPDPLYLPHLTTTFPFGLSPVDDQQLGGLVMWVPANLPLLALVLWRLLAGLGPQAKTSAQ